MRSSVRPSAHAYLWENLDRRPARRGVQQLFDDLQDLRTNELELGAQRGFIAFQSSDLPTGGNELTPRLLGDVGCGVDTAVETIGFQGRQDAAGGSCLGDDLVDLVHVEETLPLGPRPGRRMPCSSSALTVAMLFPRRCATCERVSGTTRV